MRTPLRHTCAFITYLMITINSLNAFDNLTPPCIRAGYPTLTPYALFQESISRAFGQSSTAALGSEYTCQWTVINGNAYLAAAGEPGQNNVRVIHFNPTTGVLTPVPGAGYNHGASIFSLAWFAIGPTNYLVVVGAVAQTLTLQILEFVPGTSPTAGTFINRVVYNHGATLWAVSPINIDGIQYIAIGGQKNSQAIEGTILRFNPPSTLTPVVNIPHGNTIKTLTWNAIGGFPYLALGGSPGTDDEEIRIFLFLPADQNPLTQVATFNFGNTVWSMGWYNLAGAFYLSTVGGSSNGSNIGVLQFDPVFQTLTLVGLFDHGNITMTQAWQLIAGTNYLAIGGGKNSNQLDIYARLLVFDQVAGTLSPSGNTATIDNINTVWAEDWLTAGANFFLALVGFPTADNITIRIYKFSFSSLTFIASFFHTANGDIYSVSWQDIGDISYLAIAGRPTVFPATPPFTDPVGAGLRILQFDPVAETLTSMAAYIYDLGGTIINSVDWLTIAPDYFVAFGADAIPGPPPFNQIRVFRFLTPNTLQGPLATFDYPDAFGENISTVKWLTFAGRYFLAFGVSSIGTSQPAQVLEFNGINNLSVNAVYNLTPGLLPAIAAVDWLVINNTPYLAIGGIPTTIGAVVFSFYILKFDPNTPSGSNPGTLTHADTGVGDIFGTNVNALSWTIIGGIPYLAAASGNEVKVVQFDPATKTVTLVPNSTTNFGDTVTSLAWKKANGTNYLAVGGSPVIPIQVKVYQFNPGSELREIQSFGRGVGRTIRSVSWLEKLTNLYLGIGGFGDAITPQVQVLEFVP